MTNSVIPTPSVSVSESKVVTTSVAVAKYFGKLHKNVTRDIKNLIEQAPELRGLNFEPSSIEVPSNLKNVPTRKVDCFLMDRKGFVLLAMGFTGANALQFKIAYIDAFDAMERQLHGINETLDDYQQARIQDAVAHKARKCSSNYQLIYRALKQHFQVPKYSRIPKDRFQEALDFIQSLVLDEQQLSDPMRLTPGELNSLDIVVRIMDETYHRLDDLHRLLQKMESPFYHDLGHLIYSTTLSHYALKKVVNRNQKTLQLAC